MDGILDLIFLSVYEGFPTYSWKKIYSNEKGHTTKMVVIHSLV